jgi:hypothetical protein
MEPPEDSARLGAADKEEAEEDAYAYARRSTGTGTGTADAFDAAERLLSPHASTPRLAPRRSSRSSVDASVDTAALMLRDRLRAFLAMQVALSCVVSRPLRPGQWARAAHTAHTALTMNVHV